MQYIPEANTCSIELPPHWSPEQDDTCATFIGSPQIGALQMSSYTKFEEVSAIMTTLQSVKL